MTAVVAPGAADDPPLEGPAPVPEDTPVPEPAEPDAGPPPVPPAPGPPDPSAAAVADLISDWGARSPQLESSAHESTATPSAYRWP